MKEGRQIQEKREKDMLSKRNDDIKYGRKVKKRIEDKNERNQNERKGNTLNKAKTRKMKSKKE